MDEIDVQMQALTVTCTTRGCLNKDVAIEVQVDVLHPAVICGACGEWIVDPDDGTVLA